MNGCPIISSINQNTRRKQEKKPLLPEPIAKVGEWVLLGYFVVVMVAVYVMAFA